MICWRSGELVEQRKLNQWFLKITHYAEDLLASLDQLPRWPEKVRIMQQNWIGKSEGARVFWPLVDKDGTDRGESVEVLAENGEPVEFGQPLFLVKKS